MPDTELLEHEKTYFTAGALKALGDGKIGGYLVVWGSPQQRDLHGEYFTPQTDLALDWYDKRPVLFHHGLDSNVKGDDIGFITRLTPDDYGLYAEAELDMNNPTAARAYQYVTQGKLGWSSGSLGHLADVEPTGEIKKWPIVEGSLTPTPAEPRRTTVHALKSAVAALESDTDALREPEAIEAAPAREPDAIPVPLELSIVKSRIRKGVKTHMDANAVIAAAQEVGLDAEQTLKLVSALSAAEGSEPEVMADVSTEPAATPEDAMMAKADAAAAKTEQAPAVDPKAIADAILQRMKTAPATEQPPAAQRQPQQAAARISIKTIYNDLSAQEMSYLAMIQKARGIQKDEKFFREMAEKAVKSYNAGEMDVDVEYGQRLAIKANENNNTTDADSGGDWVPTLWSSDLWRRVRIDNAVASQIETFAMPSQSYEYPIESSDPVVYAVAEATATAENEFNSNVFTKSKVTTDKLTFTAKKLGLQVVFSTEIEEDSIIPFIPRLREQALRAMANAIDNVILNADDTTGTGNINYKGANTSAAPKSKFLYGGGDGMRHLALVTNTDVSKDAGGAAPTLQMLRQTRFKMLSSLNAYGIDPSLLVMFVDPYTYGAFLNIDEISVYMTNGRGATVNDGLVPTIDGTPVFASAELALTDSTGYAMADGSGTLGQVVFANKNAWKLGYRRQVTSDVSYVPYNDEYILTITARLALKNRDTISAALLYNVGV